MKSFLFVVICLTYVNAGAVTIYQAGTYFLRGSVVGNPTSFHDSNDPVRCEIEYVVGDEFDCSGSATCEVVASELSEIASRRAAACTSTTAATQSSLNTLQATIDQYQSTADQLTAKHGDLERQINQVPAKILTDEAVVQMRTDLRQQLESSLSEELKLKLEQYVQDRINLEVPMRVAEEVQKALEERGL